MEKYEHLLVSIRRIIRAIDLRSKKLSREAGVTGPQLLALQAVIERPGITSKEISDSINLSQATVTTILDRLQSKAMIERVRDEHDRRRVAIHLTEDGHQVIKNAPKALEESFIEEFDNLEEWEQSLLLSSVERIATMMNAEKLDAAPILKLGEIAPE